jgi:ATP-dependent DNA ligase
MPLVRVPGPFDHPEWIFELKHNGFRALARVDRHRCTLVSRRRHVYTQFRMLNDEIARGAEDVEDDGEPFEEKMARLVAVEALHDAE